jgi:ADYC domain-containing protein
MSSVARHLILGFVVVLAPLGCAEVSAPNEASATAQISSGYIGQQGRLLLGFKNPDVRLFSFPTFPDTHVIDGGQLFSTAESRLGYAGVPVTATAANNVTVSMRIAEVIAPVAPEVEWQYLLEQQDPMSGAWTAACDEPHQLVPPIDPPVTPTRAIAMPGSWTADGFYFTSPTFTGVSFACKTGVAAKCDGWGYAVTATPPTVTVNGVTTTATGPDLMQACTRMARADYCALGMPNTIDGTPIHIDDAFHAQVPVTGYHPEAAWRGIAGSGTKGFLRLPALCLSKLRWSTLPLGGGCPLLPDPRTDPKGKFCEDLVSVDAVDSAALEQQGALVFSSSSFLDAGLYTYTDLATGTRLTTSSLVPQVLGQPPAWTIPRPTGVPFPVVGQAAQPAFEATVLAPTLPAGVPAAGLVQLISYRCAGDLVTTTTPPADPSCRPIAVEGYVYPPSAPGRAPLRRWHSPTTTPHAYTTTTAASTMIANGWKLDEVVGGVIRAAIDVNVRWSAVAGSVYTLDVETGAGEWIPSCIASATIGTATSFAYRGVCVGAANRAVNHADIIAFRVTATTSGQSTSATVPYDGFSSDPYLALANGTTTALAVHWNSTDNAIYAVDVRVGLSWQPCADTSVLANDTAYVHTGRCVATGATVPVPMIGEVRVCSFDRTTHAARSCGIAAYDGKAAQVTIAVK